MKNIILWTIILAVAVFSCPGIALAQDQETTPPAAPAQPPLTVDEAVMCTGVVDRVPQGIPQPAAPTEAQPGAPTVPADPTFIAGKVYCFTKVSGATSAVIKHVWYFGDKAVHTMELAIGGSPWRTWSNKTIPQEMTGSWKVEIQDAAGSVLKTLNFTVQ